MGKCKFCGEPAGFLRNAHKECKAKDDEEKRLRELAKQTIITEIENAGVLKSDLSSLEKKITEIAESNKIDNATIKNLVVSGWEKSVERAFDDGVLTEEEQYNLTNLMEHFSLSQNQLDRNGAFTKIVKGAVLRDVMNGIIPERVKIDGTLPFNLQKTEKVVWVFQDVDYYEEKTRTHYVGGSQSVSIRIAKGLYYRTGAFKGQRVQTSETVHVDTGLLGVTNKHIYFAGASKRFRINYNKIVAFEPYSDGIGVQRDAQTAKPQTFVTGDGWFTYNLITNLAQM